MSVRPVTTTIIFSNPQSMLQLLASGPQVAITCTGRMIVQSALSDLMKIKRAFGRLLFSESCGNFWGSGACAIIMRAAFLGLTMAALCQTAAFAQTNQRLPAL